MSKRVLTSRPPCPCSWIPLALHPEERDLGLIPRIKAREGSDAPELPCWTLFCKCSQSLFPAAILGLAVAAQTLPTPEAPQTMQITEFITQGKPGPCSGITEAFLRSAIIVEPAGLKESSAHRTQQELLLQTPPVLCQIEFAVENGKR